MAVGSLGPVRFFNDFTFMLDSMVPAATGENLGGGVGLVGVNEGVLDTTNDESGGVLDITTDTGDNDNQVLVSGVFVPSEGGMWMEARFKITDSVAATRAAVFCGFTETLSDTTPVMPFERATATNDFNGSGDAGALIGMAFDSDSTILEFFAVAGNDAAGIACVDANGAAVANGVQQVTGSGVGSFNGTILTADRWYIVRVEINASRIGRVYFGDYDGGASLTVPLREVLRTTTLMEDVVYHAVLMIENRSAANERLEVDYFMGEGGRNWAAN